MPINNGEAKIGCKGIQMPQAWRWDSWEISLLWGNYTAAAAAAAAAKVFLLDSCPRLPTPSVSQRNHGKNRIFRVIVTGSCLSPLQNCLVPPYYSIYCSSKKSLEYFFALKDKKKKKKEIFKRYGEKGPFTMTFRAKREKRHLTDH